MSQNVPAQKKMVTPRPGPTTGPSRRPRDSQPAMRQDTCDPAPRAIPSHVPRPTPEDSPMPSRRSLPLSALVVLALTVPPARAEQPKPPVELTAQQDHKRMMDLLGIKQLRRGADGNSKSPNAANTDE